MSCVWGSPLPERRHLAEQLLIVVDASVLANALSDDGDDGDTARGVLRVADEIAAADLVDVETVSVLLRAIRALR